MENKKTLTLIALLAVLLGIFHYHLKKEVNLKDVRSMSGQFTAAQEWVGKPAVLFELTLLNGRHFKLSEQLGKNIVMLNFFATWCGPCKSEVPELNRFYSQVKDKNVIMIGIDAHEDKSLVEQFVQEYSVAYPIGIDQDKILNLYGVNAYPTTVVIGLDGKIQLYEAGAILNADISLKPLIDKPLTNKPQAITREHK